MVEKASPKLMRNAGALVACLLILFSSIPPHALAGDRAGQTTASQRKQQATHKTSNAVKGQVTVPYVVLHPGTDRQVVLSITLTGDRLVVAMTAASSTGATVAGVAGTGEGNENSGTSDAPVSGLDDLAKLRNELGLQHGEGTLARLDVGGHRFYGINAHGQPVSLKTNVITATHAEAAAFQQAAKAGVHGGRGRLYVDRDLCRACGTSGGARGLARQLGLEELEVVTPSGIQLIRP
ncbi:MAG TPA: deaminase [Myxococcaceae bacterium]|nr:deaminase [Myxococcaceae bacterium]